MREMALNASSSFPMAQCDICGKLVLTALAFDDNGRQRLCVHCDQPVGTSLEWVIATELEERGYTIGTPKPSGKGCGSGGGGCGTSCGTRRN
jgi:hypothetical protein